MKHRYHLKSLITAALAFVCLLVCAASAEDNLHTASMELLTAGGFPEPCLIQTFATQSFDSYVYGELMKGNEKIDISDYQIAEADLSLMLTYVINDHPDLFFVGPSIGYYKNDSYVTAYVPEYLFTGDDLAARQAAFASSVNEIADYAAAATTTIGKLLRVNDYFCTHYSYDQSLSIFRPDQLFSGGTGVCQAYMLGYAAVLDELGITNTHATSTAMQHTWNLVYVDNEWYHIDVTWNDPTPDTALNAHHRYFMLSDNGMTNAQHHSWNVSVTADSTAYDSAFWQSISTPLAPIGNTVYYLSSSAPNGMRSVLGWNSVSGASSSVFDFSLVGADQTYTFSAALGPVAADADFIYYGSRGLLWAAGHSGEDPLPVFSTGDDNVHIWSCWLEDGMISMLVGEANGDMSVVHCAADQRLCAVFEPEIVELMPGESMQVSVDANLVLPSDPVFMLSSSNEDVITIDAGGIVKAVSTGAAHIIATSDSCPDTLCPVIVHAQNQLVLPEGVVELKKESFTGISAVEVILPDGIKTIGANTFSACADLVLVSIPDDVESINPSAFPDNSTLTLICSEGSAGAAYAEAAGINHLSLPETSEE